MRDILSRNVLGRIDGSDGAHRDEAVAHSMPYARDMNEQLAGKFIGMYVNDFTRDYGETGRAAIRRFLGDARTAGYIDKLAEIEFAE